MSRTDPPMRSSDADRQLPPGYAVAQLEASNRGEALNLLCGGRDQHARVLGRRAEQYGVDMRHWWGGFDEHGRLRDVCWLSLRPGRTALCLISQPRHKDEVNGAAAVVRQALEHLPRQQAHLVQALLEPTDRLKAMVLEAADFVHLADLSYLHRLLRGGESLGNPPDGLALEHWHPDRRADWLTALEASYEQTLDCPKLHGLREPEDVMEGHQATGRFDPILWTMLRNGSVPAAVCLVNPVPEQMCAELVYLGVNPSWRGKGLGRWLVRHAMDQCLAHRIERLTLAVDESNHPAKRLYERCGFKPITRRSAWIRAVV